MGKGISIFVSTTPFAQHDSAPAEWLAKTGWRVMLNDRGRRLTPHEVAELACDCDGIIAGTEDLGPLLDVNKRLKMISRVGVGLDSVPLLRCRERRISVSYTPDAVRAAVAEFTIGTMLAAARHICTADRQLRHGIWRRPMGGRLGESRIGIVGFGRIGRSVAHLLSGFAPVELLVCDILDKSADVEALRAQGLNARLAAHEHVYADSDIITLHVPLKPSTRGMIGAAELRRMKKGALLCNCARGGIVEEAALYDALCSGHLGGAAIDVFDREPYDGPLKTLENVVLTSHMGSCSVDCRAAMERDATADLIRFFRDGCLTNPVPEEEYGAQV